MKTSSDLQKPLDRIATGWRIGFGEYGEWEVWLATADRTWKVFADPKKALAEYLRLTEARKDRESKGKS